MINKEDLLNNYILFDGDVLVSFEEYAKKEYENPFRGLDAEVFLESKYFPLVSLQNNYLSTVSLMNEQGSTFVLPIYKEIGEDKVTYKSAYSGVSLEDINVSIYGYVIFDISELKSLTDTEEREEFVNNLINSYDEALHYYNIFMSDDFYKVTVSDGSGNSSSIMTNYDTFDNFLNFLKDTFNTYSFDNYEIVSKADYDNSSFFNTAEESLSE